MGAGVLLGLVASLLLEARRAPASFAGDNGRIAIQSDRSGDAPQIFTMNKRGGDLEQLDAQHDLCRRCAYSPDADRILFNKLVGGKGDVFVMDADGHHKKDLTKNPAYDTSPSFSPNGRRILFESDRTRPGPDLHHARRRQPPATHHARLALQRRPRVLPLGPQDRLHLVLTSSCKSAIITMNLDGTHRHRLTDKTHCQY